MTTREIVLDIIRLARQVEAGGGVVVVPLADLFPVSFRICRV